MVNTNILPHNCHFENAKNFLESFDNGENKYYLFVGQHVTPTNSALQSIEDTHDETLMDAYRDMIQGKHISSNDIVMMVRNIPYETNKVFDMYDDADDLSELDYFCIVNATSYYHLFKCLDNNMGANSTIQPAFSDISGANTNIYRTSDGYVWKYMTSVSSASQYKFETEEYFPVFANATVTAAATVGSLDVIKIEDTGLGYDNYVSGSFQTNDIQISGDPQIYQITNNSIDSTNGFYTGCLIYLSSGTGLGQYRTIEDYYSNSNGNYIVIDQAFTTTPLNGTSFQITPKVNIVGTGTQTVNAVARALVNSAASNSIHRIEILERGLNYTFITANVIANSVVVVRREADIRPIHSPVNGHGYNAALELGSKWVEVSLKMSNSESNTILTSNQFRQVGVIKNPLFANVKLTIANTYGNFLNGEDIYDFSSYTIVENVNTYSNTIIRCPTGNFDRKISNGQVLYLTDDSGALNQIVNVVTVTNSSQIIVASNVSFTNNAVNILSVNVLATAVVSNVVSSTILMVTDCNRDFTTEDKIIGLTSGAVATVNVVSRNDVTKNFNTFIQLNKARGVIGFGAFEENEVVFQGNLNTANAVLHSVVNNGSNVTIYMSNQYGQFTTVDPVIGNDSEASITLTDVYSPELVFGSGSMIYLENINAKTRSNTETETFQLIFNF